MRFPARRQASRSRARWVPEARAPDLSPEQAAELESDDLAQLLAATNAKRAARGKPPLSTDDVQMRLWVAQQEMHRG